MKRYTEADAVVGGASPGLVVREVHPDNQERRIRRWLSLIRLKMNGGMGVMTMTTTTITTMPGQTTMRGRVGSPTERCQMEGTVIMGIMGEDGSLMIRWGVELRRLSLQEMEGMLEEVVEVVLRSLEVDGN